MWVIRELQVVQHQAGAQVVPYAFNCWMIPDFKSLVVSMYDTSTCMRVVVDSLDAEQFISVLEDYEPYGMIRVDSYAAAGPGPTPLLTFLHDMLFVSIDDASYRFLELIDSVELIQEQHDNAIVAKYWPINMAISKLVRFSAVDVANSLFQCHPSHAISWCGCTLFHVVAYSVQAWDDRYFYIFGGRLARLVDNFKTAVDTSLYRVSFVDFAEAQRYVTKARVINLYNPIKGFIEKYGFDL